MLSTKIKISQINNLTDARYFAAAGVDYLGFCCNPGTQQYCSVSKIQEMKQWIEGPEFVLEFDGWQNENDVYKLLKNGLGTVIHFGTFATYQNSFEVKVFKDYIIENLKEGDFTHVDYPVIRSDRPLGSLSKGEIENILQAAPGKDKFLDFPINVEELPLVTSIFPDFGLILRGGAEERIGFKSFDELDLIFDILS